jgi:hypothetical protein
MDTHPGMMICAVVRGSRQRAHQAGQIQAWAPEALQPASRPAED